MKKINYKIIKKVSNLELNNFLKKISDKYFKKNKNKALIFYKRKGFIINKNFNNPTIKKWILRCQKFDKKTFEKRYLLYDVNNEKVLLPK